MNIFSQCRVTTVCKANMYVPHCHLLADRGFGCEFDPNALTHTVQLGD